MGYFLTEDEIEQICTGYKNGESGIDLAKRFHVSHVAIYAQLRKHKIERRSNRQSHIRLSVDEFAFDTITEHSAYWIGFLMADGNINHRRDGSPELALVLSENDRQHLIEFKNFLKSEHSIVEVPTMKAVRISIRSRKLVNSLEKYNVVPRKSFTTEAPNDLIDNRNFWRGVIDGDGTIGIYSNKPRLELCGSEKLVVQFTEYVKSHIESKATIKFTKGIFRVQFSCMVAVKIANLLYEDCGIALNRKLNAARNLAALGRNRQTDGDCLGS